VYAHSAFEIADDLCLGYHRWTAGLEESVVVEERMTQVGDFAWLKVAL